MGRPKGAPNKQKQSKQTKLTYNTISVQLLLQSVNLTKQILVVVRQILQYLQRTNITQYNRLVQKLQPSLTKLKEFNKVITNV